MFPSSYLEVILNYLSTRSTKDLALQFQKLSHSYRQLDCKNSGSTKQDVDAYLVGRLPLTFSVMCDLFNKLSPFLPSEFSVTDYGCGPATALLALRTCFDKNMVSYLGIEGKQAMLDAAFYLDKNLDLGGQFVLSDVVKHSGVFTTLGLASYLLNELNGTGEFYDKLLNNHDYILVIEPGTPDGYKRILSLRDYALSKGFFVQAPCPHQKPCPLNGDDWCHFFTRVNRPKILKQIKEASLGYEDEKYIYLLLSKHITHVSSAIVLETPVKHPFKIDLKLCCSDGTLQRCEVLKKDKDAFKKAKKAECGDFV